MRPKNERCPVCKTRTVLNPAHLASFQHHHAAEIRSLLSSPLVTVSSLAKKFGVSRQAAHVAVRNLGIKRPDLASKWECRAAAYIRTVEGLKPILSLVGPGFRVMPIAVKSGTTFRVLSRLLIINGHRCLILHASYGSPSLTNKFGPSYVQLPAFRRDSPLNKGVEFVICILPPAAPAEGCLVIPVQEAKPQGIIVKIGAYKPGYPRRSGAKWRKYLNAWGGLMQRGSAPLGTPGTPAITNDTPKGIGKEISR